MNTIIGIRYGRVVKQYSIKELNNFKVNCYLNRKKIIIATTDYITDKS